MKVRPENIIHESLKGGQSINVIKEHHNKLIVTFMGSESHFVNVFFPSSYLVVTKMQIQFNEVLPHEVHLKAH